MITQIYGTRNLTANRIALVHHTLYLSIEAPPPCIPSGEKQCALLPKSNLMPPAFRVVIPLPSTVKPGIKSIIPLDPRLNMGIIMLLLLMRTSVYAFFPSFCSPYFLSSPTMGSEELLIGIVSIDRVLRHPSSYPYHNRNIFLLPTLKRRHTERYFEGNYAVSGC